MSFLGAGGNTSNSGITFFSNNYDKSVSEWDQLGLGSSGSESSLESQVSLVQLDLVLYSLLFSLKDDVFWWIVSYKSLTVLLIGSNFIIV